MFRKLRKPLKLSVLKERKLNEKLARVQPQPAVLEETFSADIETNVRKFQKIFGNTSDLSRRDFLLDGEHQ